MIIHFFPKSTFATPFIKFINQNFNVDEHLFFIYGSDIAYKEEQVAEFSNIIYVNNENKANFKYLIKYIYKADKLILHGLFSNKILLMLFFQPWILKKCKWVIWGGDLYYYKYRSINWKSNIKEFIRRRVIMNMGGLITQIKGDYELAKEWYGAKGKYSYSFMYPSNLYKAYNLPIDKKNNKTIYIQVGNSSDPRNNHLEVLKKLEEYLDRDIQIICPLSYGDKNYRDKVVTQGKKIFGEKFYPLLEFMKFEDYLEILNKIDIAIFNHERQQAVGNITTLLGLGKKVYIRSDITTWDFCRQHNLKVFDLLNNSPDIFSSIGESDKAMNIENVKKYFSLEKLILDYKNILNS